MKSTHHAFLIVLACAGSNFACSSSPGGGAGGGGSPGVLGSGGTAPAAGGSGSGGGAASSAGGATGAGGSPLAAGGGGPTGGATGAGGGPSTSCTFNVSKNEISPQMATVGIVEWSVSGATPDSAKIVFELEGADAASVSTHFEAPVDLGKPNFRTLLLGLKQSSDYSFRIEAVSAGQTCVSPDYELPTTGTLSAAPEVTVEVAAAASREPGFIVGTSGETLGQVGGGAAVTFILDADGDVVWAAPAPASATRSLLDYEGENMWMLANNVQNATGEMRYLSLDGQDGQNNVEGLSKAHHDFTVLPGGKIAAMVWVGSGNDPESDLVIRSPDGSIETPFRIGANLYASDSYHCNAIHYIPEDDSFTISDRNPHLYVKVSSSGVLEWQLGGDCDGAPAGAAKCSAQDWRVNHGHQLLGDGTFVLFNNGQSGNAHVREYQISATEGSMTASLVKDYTGTFASSILGDVQRLPGGNTLITYSVAGKMVEVDANWSNVQTFTGSIGYASWRPTLYGPPPRL